MSARMKAKFFVAMTDLHWGSMLAERKAEGDTEKARDLLAKAQAAAAAHGYGNIERRAAAALQLLDAPQANDGSPARSVSPHVQ